MSRECLHTKCPVPPTLDDWSRYSSSLTCTKCIAQYIYSAVYIHIYRQMRTDRYKQMRTSMAYAMQCLLLGIGLFLTEIANTKNVEKSFSHGA